MEEEQAAMLGCAVAPGKGRSWGYPLTPMLSAQHCTPAVPGLQELSPFLHLAAAWFAQGSQGPDFWTFCK